MNAIDCKTIMEHLPIIEAVASGKDVYFAAFDWRGKFIEWRRTNKVLLSPLAHGHYVLKPRYQVIAPGKFKGIPYRSQQESIANSLVERARG